MKWITSDFSTRSVWDHVCTVVCAGGYVTCIGICTADGPVPILDTAGAKLSVVVGTAGAVGASAAVKKAAGV